MLTIRKEQVQKFQDLSFETFIDEMVVHIQDFAPRHAEVIGEKGVREVIYLGIERAKRYGFTKKGPVRFYIELMFMFGSYFDTDFLLPWAEKALMSESKTDQLERADMLYDNMAEYLEKVSGPKDEYAMEALRKINKSSAQDYNIVWDNFDSQTQIALKDIHPQKYDYVGEDLINKLILRGRQIANLHSITTAQGTLLMVALIFAIGHGFADDPLFPWISATLRDVNITDANKRAERLEQKMRTYLGKALNYLEEIKK